MRTKMLAGAIIVCCAATSLVFTRQAASTTSATRHRHAHPNIVLILTDDQRYDTLWSMPHVRRLLRRHGVTFTNAFVVNPLCCPSRASILTGRYSHGTGVYQNSPPHGGYQSFHDRSTIATWLHHAGYQTALVGKYLNGYGSTGGRVPPGWDGWFAMLSPNAYYGWFLQTRTIQRGYGRLHEDYSTNVLGDIALRFIDRARSPFFLYFAPYAPHLPAIPAPRDSHRFRSLPRFHPPNFNEADVSDKPQWVQELAKTNPFLARHLRRVQYQTLVAVDRIVGQIVAKLAATHQLHRTMIVFMSDNGLMWGEHRMSGIKEVPYEESIRVPMVIRYDPITSRHRRAGHFALNIDIAPTFAALAGVRAPDADGHSLLPVLRRRAKSWRTDFLIEHLNGGHPPPTYCAVRNRRYIYVLYNTGEQELYDLKKDPFELRNLSADPAMALTLTRLHRRLIELCDPPPPGYNAVTGRPTPAPSPSASPSPAAAR